MQGNPLLEKPPGKGGRIKSGNTQGSLAPKPKDLVRKNTWPLAFEGREGKKNERPETTLVWTSRHEEY